MLNNVEIRRPSEDSEVDATVLLWVTVFRSLANIDDDERWFKVDEWSCDAKKELKGEKTGQITVLSMIGANVVGAITGYKLRASDGLFYLDTLAVKEDQRGNGISIELIKKLIQLCKEQKVTSILLDTNLSPEFGGASSFWDKLCNRKDMLVEKLANIDGYWDGSEGQVGVLYRIRI